ncbi:MAG: ParB/RepB/Spo0J family partition protein [Lachnospiraceae bacterium]|nr:ParB/RepB/Spo0J family partition protein [Lachnospiraceae bacterium]
MSRKVAGKIRINAFSDLVGVTNVGGEITEVPLADLHEFKGHPFRVMDDERMQETVQSVMERGVLTPGIVRPRLEGGYEIISGHRRKRACELVGKETMPVIIKNYSDAEATAIMVDTNIQREDILPSEKARAYRMKFEALKHPGTKAGGSTAENLGETAGETGKTVKRYIRLSYLTEELLDLVDKRRMTIMSGVHLSYLTDREQGWVADILRKDEKITAGPRQASLMKTCSRNKELTRARVEEILMVRKLKPRRIIIDELRILDYFPENVPEETIETVIFRLLDEWKACCDKGT